MGNFVGVQFVFVVNEIRKLNKFLPKFWVNLAGGFAATVLFAVLLMIVVVFAIKDPSPVGIVEKLSKQSEIQIEAKKNGQ